MAFRALVNRDFGLLWSGKTISQLGDKFYGIALSWWVLEKTGSAAAMGLMMTLSILPGLVLGILGGPLVDRWDRKAILVASDLARGLAVGLLALLCLGDRLSLGWVFAGTILLSFSSALFDPASQAAIPLLVKGADLPRANSLNQISNGLTAVAGPILGALGVGLVGYAWVFAGNALSYFVSAALEGALRLGRAGGGAARADFGRELKEGFAFLGRRPALVRIIAVVGATHFFTAGLMVSLPVLARRVGGTAGIGALGLLEAATGLGLIAGALVLVWWGKARMSESALYQRVLGFGAVFLGLGLAAILAPSALLPLLIFALAFGGLVAQAGTIWSSILQERIPPKLAGRVFSLSALAGNAAMPLAFAVVGILLERAPVPAILLAGAGLLGLFACWLLARAGRDAPSADPRAN